MRLLWKGRYLACVVPVLVAMAAIDVASNLRADDGTDTLKAPATSTTSAAESESFAIPHIIDTCFMPSALQATAYQ